MNDRVTTLAATVSDLSNQLDSMLTVLEMSLDAARIPPVLTVEERDAQVVARLAWLCSDYRRRGEMVEAISNVCDCMERSEDRQRREIDRKLERLRSLTGLQCSPGNWDYDAYQLGLANGLLLALATLGDGDYEPLNPPPQFIVDMRHPRRPSLARRIWRKLTRGK